MNRLLILALLLCAVMFSACQGSRLLPPANEVQPAPAPIIAPDDCDEGG